MITTPTAPITILPWPPIAPGPLPGPITPGPGNELPPTMPKPPVTILPYPNLVPEPGIAPDGNHSWQTLGMGGPTDPCILPGPGSARFGSLQVDYALNGITHRRFDLLGPVIPPAIVTASLADAIAGAKSLLRDKDERTAYVISARDEEYVAQYVYLDAESARVLGSKGPVPGVARFGLVDPRMGLRALVTAGNVLDAPRT